MRFDEDDRFSTELLSNGIQLERDIMSLNLKVSNSFIAESGDSGSSVLKTFVKFLKRALERICDYIEKVKESVALNSSTRDAHRKNLDIIYSRVGNEYLTNVDVDIDEVEKHLSDVADGAASVMRRVESILVNPHLRKDRKTLDEIDKIVDTLGEKSNERKFKNFRVKDLCNKSVLYLKSYPGDRILRLEKITKEIRKRLHQIEDRIDKPLDDSGNLFDIRIIKGLQSDITELSSIIQSAIHDYNSAYKRIVDLIYLQFDSLLKDQTKTNQ